MASSVAVWWSLFLKAECRFEQLVFIPDEFLGLLDTSFLLFERVKPLLGTVLVLCTVLALVLDLIRLESSLPCVVGNNVLLVGT